MYKQKMSDSTVEEYLKNVDPIIKDLFYDLNAKIMGLKNVQSTVTSSKSYIGYRYTGRKESLLFVEMHVQKRNKKIVFHLRPVDYVSSKLEIIKKPDTHDWTLDRLVDVYNKNDVDEIMNLIKQSYKNASEVS